MNKNRRLHELLGLCWHEYGNSGFTPGADRCIHCDQLRYRHEPNPDFTTDPLRLLKEMMKRDDWPRFLDSIGGFHSAFAGEDGLPSSIKWVDSIPLDFILDTTGKLRDAAWEWLEGSAGDRRRR